MGRGSEHAGARLRISAQPAGDPLWSCRLERGAWIKRVVDLLGGVADVALLDRLHTGPMGRFVVCTLGPDGRTVTSLDAYDDPTDVVALLRDGLVSDTALYAYDLDPRRPGSRAGWDALEIESTAECGPETAPFDPDPSSWTHHAVDLARRLGTDVSVVPGVDDGSPEPIGRWAALFTHLASGERRLEVHARRDTALENLGTAFGWVIAATALYDLAAPATEPVPLRMTIGLRIDDEIFEASVHLPSVAAGRP